MRSFYQDVTEQDFDEVVIRGSQGQLVIVDFWAPWCQPCQVLKPLLEKLAYEYEGQFLLAMVNADDAQQLSLNYGVRGIPSVKAFLDGQVVDEFSGALAEPDVREFLERNIPTAASKLVAEAKALLDQGDVDSALKSVNEALSLAPEHAKAAVIKAGILLNRRDVDEAGAILDSLRGDILDDSLTKVLKARLTFARQAQGLPGIEVLKRVAQQGDNPLQAKLDLAALYVVTENYDRALNELLDVMKKDAMFAEGAARKNMLVIFDILGSDSDLAQQYRRLMASALH